MNLCLFGLAFADAIYLDLFLVSVLIGSVNRSVKMYTSKQKIHKDKDAEPSEFEVSVAQVMFCSYLMVFVI